MYLYIFEDQTIWQLAEEPSKDDLDSIDLGILTIIKFDFIAENFMELFANAEYKTVEIGKSNASPN